MNISKNILNAINEGVLKALSFDDDFPDTLDIAMHKIGNNVEIEKIDKQLDTKYYSFKLQEMLPRPALVTAEFIKLAIEWHKEYGATYKFPYSDDSYFRTFIDLIYDLKENRSDHTIDLNWIDVTNVTNMANLFSKYYPNHRTISMNPIISEWDVSHVTNMHGMFAYNNVFNGNISEWNTSNVEDMSGMFKESRFNGNLSKWDVSNVEDMFEMFDKCGNKFNWPIEQWDVSKLENATRMFEYSLFNRDISGWNVSNLMSTDEMFYDTPFDLDLSKWDLRHIKDRDDVKMMFGLSKMSEKYNKFPIFRNPEIKYSCA